MKENPSMCMSFSDVGMARQEQITVSALRLNQEDGGIFWQRRVDRFIQELMDVTYPQADTAELVAHREELTADHSGDPAWVVILGLVAAELAIRDARAGLDNIPQVSVAA